MPKLSEVITDARMRRAFDEILGDISAPCMHLPTPWLRISTSTRVVYSRQVRGGRQVIATDGWDGQLRAYTWEMTQDWDDARGRETTRHDSLSEALRAADEAAK